MMKKTRILIVVGLLFTLVLLALGGAGWYMVNFSLTPEGVQEQKDTTSMEFLSQYPHAAEWVDSMLQTGTLRDTFLVNPKGRRLHALYAQHAHAKGTAVLVHGYTDNALRMLMLGQVYYDSLQYNLMVPDHEFHGQSEGEAIQMGWLDRLNIEQWIGVAGQLWPDQPIYLHGISMGAATVMMCSGDSLPAAVRGIIEDCGYTSVWDEFAGEIGKQFGLPAHPLMDVASWLCKLRYGWSFREASALEQVRRSTLPILFIHGDADDYVPTAMVYPLYEAKTQGYKQLWLAPESAHAESFLDHPQEYFQQVRTFLQHCQ